MSFQQMVLEQLDIHMEKSESRVRPHIFYNNVKYKILNYKTLREDTIGEKLDIHGYSDDFFLFTF